MFTIKMADHDGNHRCVIEKNVPKAFILPSRWWDSAESLGIETTSCLCSARPLKHYHPYMMHLSTKSIFSALYKRSNFDIY